MRPAEKTTLNGRTTHFTLSYPPSASSSRSASPAPDDYYVLTKSTTNGTASEKDVFVESLIPGQLPMDVYEATLPWWRAAVRRVLVKSVLWESEILAKVQVRCAIQSTVKEGER